MADDDITRPVGQDASTEDLRKLSSTALPKKIGSYSIKHLLGSAQKKPPDIDRFKIRDPFSLHVLFPFLSSLTSIIMPST